MPLGLRGVTNPVAASGAEGPEQLDDARRNAPLTVLTFERVVSLLDYEDFARAYPGIGKARGDVLWIGGRVAVFVTVAGATGGAPGGDVLTNLIDSIAGASDPSQRFAAAAFAQRYFSRPRADRRSTRGYVAADVQAGVAAAAARRVRLRRARPRAVGDAAEVMALHPHGAGVLARRPRRAAAVYRRRRPPIAGARRGAAPSARAGRRWNAASRAFEPAELLLINPAAITHDGDDAMSL